MAQFSVNASRFDPYKNFKFRVRWDGRFVAGISKVSALKRRSPSLKVSCCSDSLAVRKASMGSSGMRAGVSLRAKARAS